MALSNKLYFSHTYSRYIITDAIRIQEILVFHSKASRGPVNNIFLETLTHNLKGTM